MKRSERYEAVLRHFAEVSPHVTTELEFGSVFQLLVATVLSAQCTDKRVNQVTPELFRHYPDAAAMAEADPEDVLSFISSISYPNSKAKHPRELSVAIQEKFGGKVPSALDESHPVCRVWGARPPTCCLPLPFQRLQCPSTPCLSCEHRMGLVPKSAATPLAVERCLTKNIPEALLADAHHWLLLHGRYVCTSRKPHCENCPFKGSAPKSWISRAISHQRRSACLLFNNRKFVAWV